jgi:hypothetical protein
MNRDSVNKSVLLLLVVFISAIFLSMIRSFLMAILQPVSLLHWRVLFTKGLNVGLVAAVPWHR